MPETSAEPTAPAEPQPDTGSDQAAEVEKWKALARKHEERAKENAAAHKELEKLRTASLSETERAVAEAKAVGRSEALQESGRRLAAAEFRAAAAAANLDVAAVMDIVDIGRFVGDDGEPDTDAIKAAVEKFTALRGEPAQSAPAGFDLGPRTNAMPLNGDPIVGALKSKLGIQ